MVCFSAKLYIIKFVNKILSFNTFCIVNLFVIGYYFLIVFELIDFIDGRFIFYIKLGYNEIFFI